MTQTIGTLVILGAGGDLTKRLLLPGVGQLLASGRGRPFHLIGVGQEAMTN
jgi:glucose-6-phosphate 1-dehydrogenase